MTLGEDTRRLADAQHTASLTSLQWKEHKTRYVFFSRETLKYSPPVHHDHESQPSQTRPGGLGVLGAWGSPGVGSTPHPNHAVISLEGYVRKPL